MNPELNKLSLAELQPLVDAACAERGYHWNRQRNDGQGNEAEVLAWAGRRGRVLAGLETYEPRTLNKMKQGVVDFARDMVRECAGNKARAARRLGISRPTLYRYLGLQPEPESKIIYLRQAAALWLVFCLVSGCASVPGDRTEGTKAPPTVAAPTPLPKRVSPVLPALTTRAVMAAAVLPERPATNGVYRLRWSNSSQFHGLRFYNAQTHERLAEVPVSGITNLTMSGYEIDSVNSFYVTAYNTNYDGTTEESAPSNVVTARAEKLAPAPLTVAPHSFAIGCQSPAPLTLERSDDLKAWTEVVTTTLGGDLRFYEAARPRAFYRAFYRSGNQPVMPVRLEIWRHEDVVSTPGELERLAWREGRAEHWQREANGIHPAGQKWRALW